MDVYECFYFDFMGFYGILAMLYWIINGLDGILCFFWHLTPGATGILLNMMGMPMIRLMDRSWMAGGFLNVLIVSHPYPESIPFGKGWVQGWWSQSDATWNGLTNWHLLVVAWIPNDTNHITESQREWLWSMEIQKKNLATSGNMAIANLQGWPKQLSCATWTVNWFPLVRASVPSRWQVSWWRLIARVSWARIASWKLQQTWEKSKNIWPVIMTSVTQNKNDTH